MWEWTPAMLCQAWSALGAQEGRPRQPHKGDGGSQEQQDSVWEAGTVSSSNLPKPRPSVSSRTEKPPRQHPCTLTSTAGPPGVPHHPGPAGIKSRALKSDRAAGPTPRDHTTPPGASAEHGRMKGPRVTAVGTRHPKTCGHHEHVLRGKLGLRLPTWEECSWRRGARLSSQPWAG